MSRKFPSADRPHEIPCESTGVKRFVFVKLSVPTSPDVNSIHECVGDLNLGKLGIQLPGGGAQPGGNRVL